MLQGALKWGINGSDWLAQARLDGTFFQYQLHDARYFPAGAFGGLFPDGVRSNTKLAEHKLRLEGKLEYGGWRSHYLSVGAGVQAAGTDLRYETRNYGVVGGLIVPLGSFQDIRDPSLMGFSAPDFSDDLQFVYLQDEWKFVPEWSLTWGARYDHYSDFGSVISPRVALVWDSSPNLTVKALYGRGFRGSSLLDREAKNIPSLVGNPNLKPEKLDSFEIAFDYRPRSDLTAKLNLYYQKTEDQIRLQNSGGFEYRPENVGQQKGRGLELEGRWDIGSETRLYAAYAYQANTDETTGEDAGYTPHHLLYARLEHHREPWLFSLQGRYVGIRDRLAEDPLPRAETYGFVDALAHYRIAPSLEVGLEVRNLLDNQVEDARFGTGFPGDTPLPGRTLYLSLTGFL